MVRTRRVVGPVFLLFTLLASLPLTAETPCRTLEERTSLDENEWISYVPEGEHATVALSTDSFPGTVLIEGVVCPLGGDGLEGLPLKLVQYNVLDSPGRPASAVPSVQDLVIGTGAGFEVVSTRAVETLARGRFRAAVQPGSFALQLPWERLPQDVDVVVLNLRFSPGPELAVAHPRGH